MVGDRKVGLERHLIEGGLDFEEVPGEAAFYGPKIDVQVWSAIGKEFTLSYKSG
ncbi:MAG: hypothetical protein CM15mP87_06700 [Candidatus Neomarinimicrobiota bacterium]|nr:MAG: hypothetical protein CM15mP87_06700 [Candidatus Neomarinimicrobiota bacterium]